MTRPDLVIFDCDGVLVDTEALANRHLIKMLNAAGYPITFDEARKTLCGMPMRAVKEKVEAQGYRLGDDFVERWYQAIPVIFENGVDAIPHIETVIDAVKDAQLSYCVASSANVEKMHLTLGKTGLIGHFHDVLYSASMVARGKPFPDLFLHAAQQMGFEPSRSVVIEDSVAGTTAGTAAGMRVFSYCGDEHADHEGLAAAGGILFDDMRKLPALLGIA
ncbi:HAD family hydrolase [Phyllobacterium myrsinacearum]|uniref:HAD family phosphatase n=1 Tax=Phyllobacterium myrsinacearum TaxID=28101 RepID=A0A2S9JII1_9HYPH|nr:HAD family phosphatase [Phyllobacterium myrsinacearum]PRD52900.1 HAD family phosphatase [Phyllobacterium myrsinacearum]PWV94608.1 HAD superfamily hydrolase (TIGR01509 family) [Phyllobacterium myrsinacearum]RZV07283.1 HAD superfamily hydrolase (TIGR01509 family) [Phyllobacterium myrsinacearum]